MPNPPKLLSGNTELKRNFIEDLPYNSNLKELAKQKRRAGHLPEVLFWQQVDKGIFNNIDFDRQRVIGDYIVDFYVKSLGLAVEIDGSSHDGREEQDDVRQNFLESFGIRVYRISNNDILGNIESAMKGLEGFILEQFGLE